MKKQLFAGGDSASGAMGGQPRPSRARLATAGISVLGSGSENATAFRPHKRPGTPLSPSPGAAALVRAPTILPRQRGPVLLDADWWRKAAAKAWERGKVDSDIGTRPWPDKRRPDRRMIWRALRKALRGG